MQKDEPDFKTRVRAAVESKGLNVKQFARQAGMAYPSLRDYYSGLRKPGLDAIISILSFSGVSAEWLLLGKGPMFPGAESLTSNVDENLLGIITGHVADMATQPQGSDISDSEPGSYDYSFSERERKKKMNAARDQALIAANVYNRVSLIEDKKRQEEAINREVKSLVRLYLNINMSKAEQDTPGTNHPEI